MTKPKSAFDAVQNNFDFLRFTLASLVILSHTWPLNRGHDAPDPLGLLIKGRSLGEVAVDGFFVISGFLISGSWFRCDGAIPFLKKRVLRIYPAFIVLMIVQAFLIAPYFTEGPIQPYTMRQLALIVGETIDLVGYGYPYGGLYWPFRYNPIPDLNSAIWTIRYEFVCYVLVALLGVVGLMKRARVILVLFVLSLFAHATKLTLPSSKVLTAVIGASCYWPRLLTYFLAGSTFYLFRQRIPYSGVLAATSGAMLLVGVLIPGFFDLFLPTFGTYLLFWFAVQAGALNHFGRFGDFSYGMYLYGFPMQQIIVSVVGVSVLLPVQFLCSWVAAIACGFASWNLVECRFLSRNRSRVGSSLPV